MVTTIKLPLQNKIDITNYQRQFGNVVRFDYNRFKDGLEPVVIDRLNKELNNIMNASESFLTFKHVNGIVLMVALDRPIRYFSPNAIIGVDIKEPAYQEMTSSEKELLVMSVREMVVERRPKIALEEKMHGNVDEEIDIIERRLANQKMLSAIFKDKCGGVKK
jgi:hypothetical protein